MSKLANEKNKIMVVFKCSILDQYLSKNQAKVEVEFYRVDYKQHADNIEKRFKEETSAMKDQVEILTKQNSK